MKDSEFKTLLSSLNIATNKWIRLPLLNKIIMNTEGNQFYNPKLQKLYFDTTNMIIKIKYSRLLPCSAGLTNFSFDDKTNSLFFSKLSTMSLYVKKSFREPISGDLVGSYDPQTKEYTYSTIDSVTTTSNTTIIKFKDSTLINKIKSTNYGMKYFVLLQDYDSPIIMGNPIEMYYEKDTTKYDTDINLDTEYVEGFDFNKYWA